LSGFFALWSASSSVICASHSSSCAFRPGVQRGKRTDDAGLALFDDQRRMRDDEQRCGNDWKPEIGLENGGKGHMASQITMTFTQTSISIAEPTGTEKT
jgi:hypothetical protein